jgi:hypothetical protein
MDMAVVTSIALRSAFKVGLVIYGIFGLIGGALCSGFAFAGLPLHRMPFGGAWAGLLPLILCPILYGLLGGIATVIGALVYNLASRWVGGLEVEIH